VRILVVGSALRSVSNAQAELGLTFLEEVETAPRYRLYAVDGRFAALVEVASGGIAVPGELVEVPEALLGEILASEPPGVTQATVELADGRVVSAATGDLVLIGDRAVDITAWGGFAAYLREQQG
jgi:gamma-glutamylaminecyclotransferase